MKASNVMTKEVISVRPEATVEEVVRLLAEHRIGGVPVLDEDGKFLGMVNKRDLFLKDKPVPFSQERMPALFNEFVIPERLAEQYRAARHLTAGEVMCKTVPTVGVDDDIGQVAKLMMRSDLRRVPVVHEDKLAGVISRSDIIRLIAKDDE